MRRLLAVAVLLFPCPAWATDVQEVVSDKGVVAWLVEEHSVPLVAVRIAFRDSGTAYDPKGKGGRATMVAAMLDEGAGDLDATAYSKALEDHAINVDFAVSDDGFSGKVSTTSEFTKEAFDYLGMALNKPRFDTVALERVRQQMMAALAAEQKQPEYLLQRKWSNMLFGEHPYANPELGTMESLKALKAADLKQYAQAYMTRDKLVVAVVGDITPGALKGLWWTVISRRRKSCSARRG
jgi:zinc protease